MIDHFNTWIRRLRVPYLEVYESNRNGFSVVYYVPLRYSKRGLQIGLNLAYPDLQDGAANFYKLQHVPTLATRPRRIMGGFIADGQVSGDIRLYHYPNGEDDTAVNLFEVSFKGAQVTAHRLNRKHPWLRARVQPIQRFCGTSQLKSLIDLAFELYRP